MTRTWIHFVTAAIVLMTQVLGVAAPAGPSCDDETAVHCALACCTSGDCPCAMAPAGTTPGEPVPAVPAPSTQEFKCMPAVIAIGRQPFANPASHRPARPASPIAFLPHSPPALALHCALLI